MLSKTKALRTFRSSVESICCYNSYNKYNKKRKERNDKRRYGVDQSVPLPHIQGDILHGIHPVNAAMSSQRREIFTAFFKANMDEDNARITAVKQICTERGIPMLDLPEYVLDELSQNRPHQGVCLDVSELRCDVLEDSNVSVEKITRGDGKPAVWLLPYQIKDAMNMGAVLRSAYFFGVQQIVVPYKNSAELSPIVSKASAGTLEMLTIKRFTSGTHLNDTLQKWKDIGGNIVGSVSKADHNNTIAAERFKQEKPTLLLIGNEKHGLPHDMKKRCDVLLHIEGDGTNVDLQKRDHGDYGLDSLNVSTATAILLFALMKNR